MINKIVRKSMNKKKGLLAAIIVLLVISSVFVGISHFVYDTMSNNYEQLKIDSNVEDFRILTLPLDDEQFDKIYTTDIIEAMEEKFAISLEREESAKFTSDEGRNYSIIKYNDQAQIDKIILETGAYPTNQNEILIQPQAALQTGLTVGDKLTIGSTDYTISGTGYLIEYLMPSDFANNMIYPDFDKYMPVVMSPSAFENLDGNSPNIEFNNVYKGKFFNYNEKVNRRAAKYTKMENYKPLNVPVLDDNNNPQITKTGQLVTEEISRFLYVVDRDYMPTITGIENEIQGSQTTFVFLATLLSVITICLATLLVNSVFKSQRREMGIMKAEGISIPKLGLGFIGYMVIIIIIGGLVGAILSTFAAQAFRNVYSEMFMLKDYMITTDTIKLVIGDLAKIGIVMLIVIYFVSIRHNLNTPTLHLVKNISSEKTPKYNVGKHFKRLNFVRKYQLNLVLRNFSKTILLGFAVIVSSFLLLLGVMMYDSVHNMMDNMYGENFKFSYVVLYSNDSIHNEDEVENGMISKSVDLISVPRSSELEEPLTGKETISIEAYDFDQSTTVNLTDTDGNRLTNDYDGAIASSGIMKRYNLQIGDTITVKNPFKADADPVKIEIVAETDDYFLPYVYMPLDTFQATFDIRDDLINGYQSTEPLTVETKKQIMTEDPAAFVYEAADMEEVLGDSLRVLNIAIVIIGILASIIAFVALYSISSVIIESNSKTISVMKVLGYSSKEVRTMTIGIYKWLVIIIYLLSIPVLQLSIQSAVNAAMADMDFTIPIKLNIPLSLLGLGLIFIVFMISSTLTYKKIEKIKLAESLKADE